MIYLDNAATTFPKPPQVIREMNRCMREYCGNPGRSSHPAALRAAEAVFETRSEIAGLFGISKAENVIFAQNATHALNKVIGGIMYPHCHAITTNIEHNSVRRTLENLCRMLPASFDTVNALSDDDALLSEIESKINAKTKLVVTIHASNVCSRVLPVDRIGALCRRYGIIYVTDASQSAGIYDINITRDKISVLCAPGHKGLYGPQGTGFAAFSDDFGFSSFSPVEFGGNGMNSAQISMGRTPPESYEAGTVNVPGIVGLREGIRYVRTRGIENISSHERSLFIIARQKLSDITGIKIYLPEHEGSVLLFNSDKVSGSVLAAALGDEGICTRPGLHCAPTAHDALGTGGDAVRISFSAFSGADDVYRLVSAVRRITAAV